MAAPVTSAPASAAQIAQQKLQDQGAQQLKQGASKFDAAMANKAQATQGTQQVDQAQKAQSTTATQATTKVDAARHAEQVHKAEHASMRKVDGNQPNEHAADRAKDVVAQNRETQGANSPVMKMMGDIEKGQGVLDKLIKSGLSGRQFSNSELIAMQAGVFKYSQELELTGKVVEKATSGLKDTLKTQV